MGRRQTYALGFSIVSVFGFIIGGAMIPLQATFPAFVVLFGLFQSFLSVGPGVRRSFAVYCSLVEELLLKLQFPRF